MGRDTLRKRIIRSVLEERGSILLDELRWKVLDRELGEELDVMDHPRMTSFARTVRAHMPEVRRWNASLDRVELVAALAVNRIRERDTLERFLRGRAPTVVYRHREERYGYRNVHYFHQVDLHADPDGPLVDRVTIPWSHEAVIVGLGADWTRAQVLATVTWRVVRDT